jgi:hypothetical protein
MATRSAKGQSVVELSLILVFFFIFLLGPAGLPKFLKEVNDYLQAASLSTQTRAKSK